MAQIGATVLPEPFPVAVPGPDDPVVPRDGDAVIETFVVDGTGSVTAMGDDPMVANWWQAAVEALADRVLSTLGPLGVQIAGPIYVTVSATDVHQVIGTPHLDDDQFHPDAGIGVVAIAASHGGPRLARGAMWCRSAGAGAPLGLDQPTIETWFDGGGTEPGGPVQATTADRVVLFPRFGQLHAGPPLAVGHAGTEYPRHENQVRNLLVLRADTTPVSRF